MFINRFYSINLRSRWDFDQPLRRLGNQGLRPFPDRINPPRLNYMFMKSFYMTYWPVKANNNRTIFTLNLTWIKFFECWFLFIKTCYLFYKLTFITNFSCYINFDFSISKTIYGARLRVKARARTWDITRTRISFRSRTRARSRIELELELQLELERELEIELERVIELELVIELYIELELELEIELELDSKPELGQFETVPFTVNGLRPWHAKQFFSYKFHSVIHPHMHAP